MNWFSGPIPKRNTYAEFVSLVALKEEHAAQIAQFETWAAQNAWQSFHDAHYDWWTFPINAPSSYGFAYTVYDEEIAALKTDDDFMRMYLRGAERIAASWGWDLSAADFLPFASSAQTWQGWPIRLHKAATSLRLFGCVNEFESLQKYGARLIAQGHDFNYHGQNLKPLFGKGR